jgi:hypothetical protein
MLKIWYDNLFPRRKLPAVGLFGLLTPEQKAKILTHEDDEND